MWFCVPAESSTCRFWRNITHYGIHLAKGHCTREPTEGREYATLFVVDCSGFAGGAAPFNYRYFVNSTLHPNGMSVEFLVVAHTYIGTQVDINTRTCAHSCPVKSYGKLIETSCPYEISTVVF